MHKNKIFPPNLTMDTTKKQHTVEQSDRRDPSRYKRPSISSTPEEVHARRLAQDVQLRKRNREQLITSKRFKHFLDLGEDSEHEFDLSLQETESLRKDLKANNREKRVESLKTLANVLTDPSEALRHFVIRQDCIEILTGFLRSLDPEEQFQGLVALTNIAAGTPEMAEKMITVIPDLIGFLDGQNTDLQDQAAWALGNLAVEGEKFRDHLCSNGAIAPLINLLDLEDTHLIQTVSFALSNLARGSDMHVEELFAAGIVEKLLKHLNSDNTTETISEICWIICYMTSGQESNSTKLLDKNLAPLLTQQMPRLADAGTLALPLIRSLGNITSGSDLHTDMLLDEKKFLSNLLIYVKSDCRSVKKESLWAVSNITASRRPRVLQMVIDAGFIPVLSSIASHTNFDIRKEAAFSLVHIASHGSDYVRLLPHDELVPSFLDFIRSQDPEFVRLGLTYFQLLLANIPEGKQLLQAIPDSMDVLESISLLGDEELHHLSLLLVDNFFSDDEIVGKGSEEQTSGV